MHSDTRPILDSYPMTRDVLVQSRYIMYENVRDSMTLLNTLNNNKFVNGEKGCPRRRPFQSARNLNCTGLILELVEYMYLGSSNARHSEDVVDTLVACQYIVGYSAFISTEIVIRTIENKCYSHVRCKVGSIQHLPYSPLFSSLVPVGVHKICKIGAQFPHWVG